MIVEAPKYGASRRAAAISAPRLAAPTAKTTTRITAIGGGRATGTSGGSACAAAGGSAGARAGVTIRSATERGSHDLSLETDQLRGAVEARCPSASRAPPRCATAIGPGWLRGGCTPVG